jgi:hypothetical protein
MSWYLRTSDACGSNQSTTKQYRSSFLPCAQARQQEAVVSEAACDERIAGDAARAAVAAGEGDKRPPFLNNSRMSFFPRVRSPLALLCF